MNGPYFSHSLIAAKAEMIAAGLGASSAYPPL